MERSSGSRKLDEVSISASIFAIANHTVLSLENHCNFSLNPRVVKAQGITEHGGVLILDFLFQNVSFVDCRKISEFCQCCIIIVILYQKAFFVTEMPLVRWSPFPLNKRGKKRPFEQFYPARSSKNGLFLEGRNLTTTRSIFIHQRMISQADFLYFDLQHNSTSLSTHLQ